MSFSPRERALAAGVSGVLCAALGVGIGYLCALAVDRGSAPLHAVGSTVIDNAPAEMREWAIETFGTNDKPVLLTSIAIIMAVLAAVAGIAEFKRPPAGLVIFGIVGVVGVFAALDRPTAVWTWALPTLIGVGVAMGALHVLIGRLRPGVSGTATAPDAQLDQSTDANSPAVPSEGDYGDVERRRFLVGASVVGGAVAATGLGGWALWRTTGSVSADRAAFDVPAATNTVPTAAPELKDVTTFITPNSDFYRIDTALTVPQIKSDSWSLRIHGMVDREIRLDLDQLRREHTPFDAVVTLTCVSNSVGGDLIGNATWTGYRISDLLALAGPAEDADMVLSTSADGWTAGTPLTALTDNRDAMLAVGMNDEPLPVEHGYPVRMVVPGLYGYVSATKWVVSLEVTRFDRAKAYWTSLGWAEKGPIKTSSRIDVPRPDSTVPTGPVTVGGVAWAQHRGIAGVQVRVDDGPWNDAEVLPPDLLDAWRLWKWDWNAEPGKHQLTVRAVDGDGQPQIETEEPPVPDGATGLHTIAVSVRS
ncbi:molybdopterin-dependent oxidoreductase [Nocardia sp. 348MFTsu5.1]|uniref:molybdopterin-dependent oxidoreductase n=1 Tax=Nocardia sp. 348MFTsu5.1 TaxID=1172185 RepID=UPI00039C79B1|nr:molybdopterin-dependent oxidoreductase [Nocardia sp. 348MFTsu5.1]